MNFAITRPARALVPMAALSLVVALAAIAAQRPAAAAQQDIYPAPSQAKAEIDAALKLAAASNRRVILDFGGNWCPDCKALDIHLHDAVNRPILEANYFLVHVNVGHLDKNLKLAAQYQVPVKKGVPALAVLDKNGNVLYSQKTGEFKDMRSMQSSAVTEFLTHWKSGRAG